MPRKAKTQPVMAPQDQGYGVRGEQMAALHALPLPNNQGPTSPAAPTAVPGNVPRGTSDMAGALQAAAAMAPPQGGLDAPTNNPGEPLTAGLSTGPGPGPQSTFGVDPVLDTLKAAYRAFETPAIAALIEDAEQAKAQ